MQTLCSAPPVICSTQDGISRNTFMFSGAWCLYRSVVCYQILWVLQGCPMVLMSFNELNVNETITQAGLTVSWHFSLPGNAPEALLSEADTAVTTPVIYK